MNQGAASILLIGVHSEVLLPLRTPQNMREHALLPSPKQPKIQQHQRQLDAKKHAKATPKRHPRTDAWKLIESGRLFPYHGTCVYISTVVKVVVTIQVLELDTLVVALSVT